MRTRIVIAPGLLPLLWGCATSGSVEDLEKRGSDLDFVADRVRVGTPVSILPADAPSPAAEAGP
jgi:hypothetical protein